MPYQIRHKATGDYVSMRSGKSVWSTIGAAKASFVTSGLEPYVREKYGYKPSGATLDSKGERLGRKAWRFEHQDIFEIVEVTDCSGQLKKAEELLAWAADYLEDVHAGESEVAEAISAYFKEQEA